ncbi:MAG: hypothetical protein HY744_32415 [Deltaproteobacteria bacterium]|nr:hypothetical protein [Deltaproteobacteria bacterium]
MRESDATTLRQFHVPLVLVIGGSAKLVRTVQQAGLTAQVLVESCAAAEGTAQAARMHPLVLVLPERIYALDPESYEHLARDVRGSVLRISRDDVGSGELAQRLGALAAAAEQKRGSW